MESTGTTGKQSSKEVKEAAKPKLKEVSKYLPTRYPSILAELRGFSPAHGTPRSTKAGGYSSLSALAQPVMQDTAPQKSRA